jgi:hypothetical protein
MHWGTLADNGCAGPGTRKYSAILWDIPWGWSWEDACAQTRAPAGTPPAGRAPDNCVNSWGHMWGEWVVQDDECAAHWGAIGDSGCSAIGTRKYSAIIWNVPPNQSWEDACESTPAPAGTPVAGRPPDRCKNTGFNEWGEWDVPDGGCVPHWGEITGGCIDDGLQRYSAILWDIPPGVTWEGTCAQTAAPAGSPVAGTPTRCVNTGLNIWGEWDIPTPACVCEDRPVTNCYFVSDPADCQFGTMQGDQCCETHNVRVCFLQISPELAAGQPIFPVGFRLTPPPLPANFDRFAGGSSPQGPQ